VVRAIGDKGKRTTHIVGRVTCANRAALVAAVGMSVLVLVAFDIAAAQNDVDTALRFFADGGAYCFRIAPAGVALSEETDWTIMVLTSASNSRNTFRIRDVDAGASRLSGRALADAGLAVNGVWRSDTDRSEFFTRFEEGIRGHLLRARVVTMAPPNAGQLRTDRERVEAYLQFSERGERVSFDKGHDLTVEEFHKYWDYLPD
jgi:hypothetical protein